MTTLGQHCQLAVDVSQLQIERFKKEDCPFSFRQRPSSCRGNGILVATNENPLGSAGGGQRDGWLIGSALEKSRLGSKDSVEERGGRLSSEAVIPRRPVNARQTAVLPNGEMQDGYLAEAMRSLGSAARAATSSPSAIR